jgi:uncharacterized coiled-coil protein SlyX
MDLTQPVQTLDDDKIISLIEMINHRLGLQREAIEAVLVVIDAQQAQIDTLAERLQAVIDWKADA